MRQPRPKIVSILKRSLGRALLALGLNLTILTNITHAAEIESFHIAEDRYGIAVSGEIEPGDDAEFRAISVKREHVIVILESNGGALAPALEIGKIIRLLDLPTLVMDDSTCVSSCALIWIAGTTRYLAPRARLGFHASYRDDRGEPEPVGVGNAMIGRYLTLMNLPPKAVIFATTASPTEFLWLTTANKTEAGIDFEELILDEDRKSEDEAGSETAAPPPIVAAPPPIVAPPMVVAPARTTTKLEYDPNLAATDVERGFRSTISKPNFYEDLFKTQNLAAEFYPIFTNHMKRLHSNSKLITHISKEIAASGASFTDTETLKYKVAVITDATISKLNSSGLLRLSNDDIRNYIWYLSVMPDLLGDQKCSTIISEQKPSNTWEFQAFSKLGAQKFEDFLSLTRKAIFAELAGYPEKVEVLEPEFRIGESAYINLLKSKLSELSSDDISRFYRNESRQTDIDSCIAINMKFDLLYEMDGIAGIWYRRHFIQTLSK